MRKVFIDCGAHCGESILEAKKRFDDIEIISFEANSNLSRLLQDKFKDDDKISIENKAVWIEDSTLDFYISLDWSDGSSIYKEKISGGINENVKIQVPCFDLSSFIKNNFNEDDYIILKLDIEGAEYEVLNKIIEDGTYKIINEFHGEFHPNKVNLDNVKKIQHKIHSFFTENNVPFYEWEMVGNHEKAIDRKHWKDEFDIAEITFVIPARNNLEFLKVCYNSLKKLKGDHHILILDDASSDGTSEWLDSLNDEKLKCYKNSGPKRIGIVGMFDNGIAMAQTDIIMAFHADMVAAPNLDIEILKHLSRGKVVCATRLEPPIHPDHPSKVLIDLGSEVEDFDYNKFVNYCQNDYKSKVDGNITRGMFAPWCIYKDDFLKIGGHDNLFAPQSREDSDLFYRFYLNGYKLFQTWTGLVYHFTSRGSRFNKVSGGDTGVDSLEWQNTNYKNERNFFRKWGTDVLLQQYLEPIVYPNYDISIICKYCKKDILNYLEPLCDVIYQDCSDQDVYSYICDEQERTLYPLSDRIKKIQEYKYHQVSIYIDARKFDQNDYNYLRNLSAHITSNNLLGHYKVGNLIIIIDDIQDFQSKNK